MQHFVTFWHRKLKQLGPNAPKNLEVALTNKLPIHVRGWAHAQFGVQYPDSIATLCVRIQRYQNLGKKYVGITTGTNVLKVVTPSTTKTTKTRTETPALKLKSLPVPKFDGDILNYPNFNGFFNNLTLREKNCSHYTKVGKSYNNLVPNIRYCDVY